ncbi:hypothetical protein GGI02_002364 [Coemansia sp. RSA 2322]|nr:hypothetical protein GGI02_002364 [Coemansia sp. RSA 2322]
MVAMADASLLPRQRHSQLAPHGMQRIVRIQLPPLARLAATRDSNESTDASAANGDMAARVGEKVRDSSTANAAAAAPFWLPSDVIDAIASATVAVAQNTNRCQSMQRLGASSMLTDEAQGVLRKLSQVSRDWRGALLSRAWRSVQLTGTGSAVVRDIHAFAAPCVRRLVVPWGAMAAPIAWMAACDGSSSEDSDSDVSACSLGLSVDSRSRLGLGKACADDSARAAASACRLRCVFGDQVWPAVEHLDMSFMPLICYQGIATHIQRTMPRLRSLRIGGFVPATALAELLHDLRLPLLATLEISGSVWANADSGRRGSASSWRSSSSTVAAQDPAVDIQSDSDEVESNVLDGTAAIQVPIRDAIALPVLPALSTLVVTADALRSPAVFSYVMAQAPTLKAMHLLECDYKIMDMLRLGRMEERHMHAVEWATTQMTLHGQETPAAALRRRRLRQEQAQPVCWAALTSLHIDHYHMAPRENAGLRVHADCMPRLERLVVKRLEPSDSHYPPPSIADAQQTPRLRGRFECLARIKAPAFDTRSLPPRAPSLRYLCLTGSAGGAHVSAMLPTKQDVDALLASGLPLARASIPSQ